MSSATWTGSCHCGAIGFRYLSSVAPREWSVRACQCSFCRAHGAETTSDPSGEIEWRATDEAAVNRYRFGLETADFLLCRRCGAYAGAVIESPRGRFGIVNTRLLEPRPDGLPAAAPASYEGEDSTARIRRREQRWTPVTAAPW